MDDNKLYYLMLNGNKVIARPFVLRALLAAHEELLSLNIGYKGKMGLVFAGDVTESWRSETLQRQLVEKGASKTMFSNHRAGVAIDVIADWPYIKAIAHIMKKHNLVNDLAYLNSKLGKTSATPLPGYVAWDGGHFNWGSNAHANTYRIINEQLIIDRYSMRSTHEGLIIWNVEGDGGFALVQDGKRRAISEARAGKAALAVEATAPADAQRKVIPVPKEAWDALPEGEKF